MLPSFLGSSSVRSSYAGLLSRDIPAGSVAARAARNNMQAGRESGSLNKLDGKKCLQEEGQSFFAALAVALDVGLRPSGSACGCRGHPGARGPAIVGRGGVAGMVAAIFKQTHARF